MFDEETPHRDDTFSIVEQLNGKGTALMEPVGDEQYQL
jgi:hypothetical protein